MTGLYCCNDTTGRNFTSDRLDKQRPKKKPMPSSNWAHRRAGAETAGIRKIIVPRPGVIFKGLCDTKGHKLLDTNATRATNSQLLEANKILLEKRKADAVARQRAGVVRPSCWPTAPSAEGASDAER